MAEEKHSHKKEKKEKKRKSMTSEEVAEAMEVDEPVAAVAAAEDGEKKKKRKSSTTGGDEDGKYDQRLSALLPFAQPLAPKKLNKKVMKTVKKGMFFLAGYESFIG